MQITTKKGVGSIPSCWAMESASGNERAAAALFVISSVKMLVIRNRMASSVCGLTSSLSPMMKRAKASDMPEFTIATAKAMAKFLDKLNTQGKLTKTILYNLNPCANEVIATMLGNFQDGSVPGKIQFGSGWWFLDQKDGMEKQMNALSLLGLLSRFVGMLTDSRSFLSYPRHEYFRRTLCNLLGNDVENGEIPYEEIDRVNQMVEDICYNNAKKFFNF